MVGPSAVSGFSLSATRGTERVLWDCETVGRVLETSHVSARARPDAGLGEKLTRLLLLTPRESEPSTPHEEHLWRPARGDTP